MYEDDEDDCCDEFLQNCQQLKFHDGCMKIYSTSLLSIWAIVLQFSKCCDSGRQPQKLLR